MKTHLNTLYVTTQGAYLAKQGETVQVACERKVRPSFPLHNLEGIVCFGRVGCSPALLGACAEKGVAVSLFTEYGRFLASVRGIFPRQRPLRRQQYRLADEPAVALEVARRIVLAKVANSRSVLLRAARDADDAAAQVAILERSDLAARGLGSRTSRGRHARSVRRLEGEAATHYFGAFDSLLERLRPCRKPFDSPVAVADRR